MYYLSHAYDWQRNFKDNKQIIKAWLIVSGCAHHMASSRAAQKVSSLPLYITTPLTTESSFSYFGFGSY